MKVLIVDQFSGPTPYQLQQNPMPFDELCAEMLAVESLRYGYKTEVREIGDPATMQVPRCTTVWHADEKGMAQVLCYRWDTSG
jgi:hypothetical protein